MKDKILQLLRRSKKTSLSLKEIRKKLGGKRVSERDVRRILDNLTGTGDVVCYQGKYRLIEFTPFEKAVVTRVNGTFGFARFTEKEGEVFIPGKYLLGAMPGDKVLVKSEPTERSSDAGRVISVISQNEAGFTGVFHRVGDICTVEPDNSIRFPVRISKKHTLDAREGDKVMARIFKRGEHHGDHRAEILEVFGNSHLAKVCCKSILAFNHVEEEFPSEVIAQAELIAAAGIPKSEYSGREDLRALPIFTIDSSDSKDLDDAISIERTKNGYLLGVHIADVSHYVTAKSPLDNEAFERGTSVYYAQSVVPMLPVQLSNGICSLNPGEDRLTFTCFVNLDADGRILGYRFCKSVIRSRVKGVYSEINRILAGETDEMLKEKYQGLFEEIALMEELATKLEVSRLARGSLNLESVESKISVDAEGKAIDVQPRDRGRSEKIIEEFMLSANEAAATYAMEMGIPFVYRVHEKPTAEKTRALAETLSALSLPVYRMRAGECSNTELAAILAKAKATPYGRIVNHQLLRSMAKAKYSDTNIGHFGLVLDNYAHFTSPIRRYPDLTIHRILTDLVAGVPVEKITKRYKNFASFSAQHSSEREIAAMDTERGCEDCYKAEYILSHLGEEFEANISSVAPHGLYAELDNTVEGLIRIENLPEGSYDTDSQIEYVNVVTNEHFRIGDRVKIKVLAADVSAGHIDFALTEHLE